MRARVLARDGATVTIASRTESKLQAAQRVLADEGLEVSYAVCDALDGASVRAAVTAASDDSGALHIAVVVPGAASIQPVLLFDDDQFSREVDGNVRPVYLLLKYAGQAMIRAGFGSFVAISSTAAVFSSRYIASYGAGKAAVDQLVRIAANELGEYNIRVNSVQPGMTHTPGTEGVFANPEMIQTFIDGQPIPARWRGRGSGERGAVLRRPGVGVDDRPVAHRRWGPHVARVPRLPEVPRLARPTRSDPRPGPLTKAAGRSGHRGVNATLTAAESTTSCPGSSRSRSKTRATELPATSSRMVCTVR